MVFVAVAALWPDQQHVDLPPRNHVLEDVQRNEWRNEFDKAPRDDCHRSGQQRQQWQRQELAYDRERGAAVDAHRLDGGGSLPYDHLVLACGARQRTLDLPGADLGGVLHLRTLADADALKARIDGARRVVVGGARFIGQGYVSGVELADGVTIAADLVLIGVGVVPNDEIAAAAGLAVADGILVDRFLATSDPAIFAIGDCARHPNRFCTGGPSRIESVQNATDQARTVAARILGGDQPYDAVPWFWSEQGDLKLQIAGVGSGHDTTVLRGDPASGAFSIFCFAGGRLVAVESVNRGSDHIIARRLIGSSVSVSPAEVADDGIALMSLLVR